MKRKLILMCLLLSSYFSRGQTLVSFGSSWKYLDNGSNQGTAWRASGFSDASWASGNAQLGYGDGDEATVVSYGSSSSAKYITTYFRKTITVTDASQYTSYTLKVKRDDGIVVYINGTERYRENMPTGTIAYNTAASSACSDDGASILSSSLVAGTLVTGVNTIAVEIHQNEGASSDISFDLELTGNVAGAAASLTRGPYLQIGTPTSIVLRWRTDVATNTKVSYGTTAGSLTSSVSNASSVTEHEIKLTGLSPNTKYYYSIGSSTQTIQGNADNYFITSPPVGTPQKTRVWVTGDCGNNSTNQKNVRDKFHTYLGTGYSDVWLLAGDNAYSNGTDTEYQSGFFDIYKDKMLKQTVLWPAPGNHDYAQSSSRQNDHNIPYYSVFSVPSNAEAGGVASGTEAFYSFNYANIHFISLDSYGKESNTYRLYDTLGPQVTWLKQDLAANTQKWTVVYFHHPPYTMGSHNSDTSPELVSIRENLTRILERYKVDMIVCGHSHTYERTKLIKGHYGNEASFNSATHNLSSSSGKYDGSSNSCPYHKSVSSAYSGSVYVVTGSAGQLGGTETSWSHNAMHYSNATNGGSFIIEVEGNRLDTKWLCADGVVRDQFTLFKDVNKTTNITISQGQSVTLTASWIGNYNWSSGGATTKSVTVSPASTTTYTCQDAYGCVTDVFNVTVTGGSNVSPDASITSPSTGTSFTAPASIIINASATDSDGTISSVEFYNGSVLLGTDNSSPYSFTWTGVSAGTYQLTVKAYDNLGAVTTSAVVSVTVTSASNQSPAVSITSPASGTTYNAPASISIAANANDADGTISKVEFYYGSVLLGSDNSSPYSYSWTNVAAGTYAITAVAYDNLNAQTSALVSVVVNPSTGTCTAPVWNASTAYLGGDVVQYNGIKYVANWWTQNNRPDLNSGGTGSGKPWTSLGTCNSKLASDELELLKSSALVYPNPATNVVFVDLNSADVESVQIVDSDGTVLISVIGVNEVNISSLSNGIYIARIKTSGTTFVRQIVKQ